MPVFRPKPGILSLALPLLLMGLGAVPERALGQYDYPGRSPDADWRDAAQDRIEQHRKADLNVDVLDAEGNPVEGATVDVLMQQHEFNFGTAINADIIREQTSSNSDPYRKNFLETFNYGTIETRLKVYRWEGNPNPQDDVHFTIDWLNDQGYGVRGHAALWESWWWNNMDEGSEHYYGDLTGQEIDDRIKGLIQDRVSEFAGEVRDWDMQNHPKHRQEIRNYLDSEYGMGWGETVPGWWEVAHNNDPDANMGINEQNIVQKYDWAGEDGWRDSYEWWLNSFHPNNGVNVEGVGMMAHAQLGRLTGIPEVLDVYDRFGQYAPIYISELHITYEDFGNKTWTDGSAAEKSAQADYLRDFLTASFSHPDVETVVHWTFWEGAAWRGTSALYEGPADPNDGMTNWDLRDHGQEWRRLINQEWWTDDQGQTNAQGTYSTRGFKGDYEVAVSDNGRTRVVPATLSDGGTNVEVSGIPSLYGSEDALMLGAGDDYARLEEAESINTDGPFETRTIDLWFKAATVEGGTPQMLYEEGGGQAGFNIFVAAQELYAGAWNEQGGDTPYPDWDIWFSTPEVEAGTWHHVALVYDEPNGRLRAYLDGEPFGTATPDGKVAAHADDNGIGNRAGSTNLPISDGGTTVNSPFEGTIDQVRVWDAGFTKQEVQTWMRRTVSDPLGREDLLATYRFDEELLDEAYSVNTVYEGGSPQFTASGASLGQLSQVVADGTGGVGSVSVDVAADAENDAVQVYQFGEPNGDIRTVESGAAESRLSLVWGLGALGSPSADATFDFSAADGVNDPSTVKLLRRAGPNDSWTDVTSDWTRDGASFTKENVSSFGEFAVGGPRNNLPVELTGLRGTRADDGIKLTWQTTSETNNAGFRILRSDAGDHGGDAGWTDVGFVEGAGTTSDSKRYRFTDREVPFAADALTYRLKQVDTDGTTTLSETVTVERAPVDAARLLPSTPNPAQEQVRVRFTVPEQSGGESVTLKLFDMLGRQVRSVQTSATSGRHRHQFDVSGLNSGTYFLRLEAGGQTDTQRLTVVR